jgi:hypothetical protein
VGDGGGHRRQHAQEPATGTGRHETLTRSHIDIGCVTVNIDGWIPYIYIAVYISICCQPYHLV